MTTQTFTLCRRCGYLNGSQPECRPLTLTGHHEFRTSGTAGLCEGCGTAPLAPACEPGYPVALLNTAILTADGDYSLIPLPRPEDALDIITASGRGFVSAIGHEATATIMSGLLGLDVPVNRIAFRQVVGQRAIVFKLRGRPAEGQILDVPAAEAIGYDLKLLVMVR